jgi:hypothetical protein
MEITIGHGLNGRNPLWTNIHDIVSDVVDFVHFVYATMEPENSGDISPLFLAG